MQKLVTGVVNNKLRTRKSVTLTKNDTDGYDVAVETCKFNRYQTEVLVSNAPLQAAHFRYVQHILSLHSDGYLIEIGHMNAYE